MTPLYSVKTLTIAAIVVVSLLFSCKPDINVNAPYKEVPVVYGLLNQRDSVHYVKITKAFLGEADAYEMAKVRDSSDYGDNLTVTIEEIKGNSIRKFNLERIEVTRPSEPISRPSGGAFPRTQSLYRFKTPLNAPLDASAKYRLYAKNNSSDLEINAETSLVSSMGVSKPSTIPQRTVNFVSAGRLNDYYIEWITGKHGMRYSVKVVFNYLEIDHSNATVPDTAFRSFSWAYNNLKAKSNRGGEKMDAKISGEDFLIKIANAIPKASGTIERIIHSMDFHFDVAGEELNTYMEVNEPATGIVMERPDYTNVSGGIGVFSSRYNVSVPGKGLNVETCREIKNNERTTGRGFSKYYDAGTNQYLCIQYNTDNISCR